MIVSLEKPSRTLFPSYLEALQEGFGFIQGVSKAKTPEEIEAIAADPAKFFHDEANPPDTYTMPSGHVFPRLPDESFWIVVDSVFVGEITFRHALNDVCLQFGGQVGYGVRPSYRGRGIATQALALVRGKAAARGMGRLLVCCALDNPASEKVILNNGGVLEDIRDNIYGFPTAKRYWVNTTL